MGKRRGHNEDRLGVRFPLFVVADGMGGHKGGEVAAQIAIEEMLAIADGENFVLVEEISGALARASERVSALGSGSGAPGSTLTGLAFSTHRDHPVAQVFNIGDSRTYLLSRGEFQQVTTDHSQVQELLDSGTISDTEARSLPERNVITRALGAGAGSDVRADHFVVPLVDGSRFLMCSDGLSGEVTNSLIEMVCRAVADPQQAADELVNMALAAGGKDNISVVVVDVVSASPSSDEDVNEITARREPLHDTVPSPRRKPRRHGMAWSTGRDEGDAHEEGIKR